MFKFLIDRTTRKMRRFKMKNHVKMVAKKLRNKTVRSKTLHRMTRLPKINLQHKRKQGMLYQANNSSEGQIFA